jgi:hypothetical protein
MSTNCTILVNGIWSVETMSQKLLTMHTPRDDVRAPADAWSADDSSLVSWKNAIGFTPGLNEFHCFDSPLRAMAAGWRLLGPPVAVLNFVENEVWYKWWFVKE